MIPQFLLELLENQYGEEITKKIIDGYNSKRAVTFRINEIKAEPGEVERELEKNNIEWEKVSWSKTAFILKHITEKAIQDLDIYKSGKVYLQSLSAKFIFYVATHFFRTTRKSRYFGYGSGSWRKNNTNSCND